MFTAVKISEEIAMFVVMFVLIGNTKVFGEVNKPYLPIWCMMNGVIILVADIHLYLLNCRHNAFCQRVLVGAIFSAQANNEGLKCQQKPIEHIEMKFEAAELEMPELRHLRMPSGIKQPIASPVKTKDEIFEGSEDIAMSMEEDPMASVQGASPKSIRSTLKDLED